jgi:hypothetical protein
VLIVCVNLLREIKSKLFKNMKKQTNFDKFLTSSYGFPTILFAFLFPSLILIFLSQSHRKTFDSDNLRYADLCILYEDWEKVCRKTESQSYIYCCDDEDTYKLWKKQNQLK